MWQERKPPVLILRSAFSAIGILQHCPGNPAPAPPAFQFPFPVRICQKLRIRVMPGSPSRRAPGKLPRDMVFQKDASIKKERFLPQNPMSRFPNPRAIFRRLPVGFPGCFKEPRQRPNLEKQFLPLVFWGISRSRGNMSGMASQRRFQRWRPAFSPDPIPSRLAPPALISRASFPYRNIPGKQTPQSRFPIPEVFAKLIPPARIWRRRMRTAGVGAGQGERDLRAAGGGGFFHAKRRLPLQKRDFRFMPQNPGGARGEMPG